MCTLAAFTESDALSQCFILYVLQAAERALLPQQTPEELLDALSELSEAACCGWAVQGLQGLRGNLGTFRHAAPRAAGANLIPLPAVCHPAAAVAEEWCAYRVEDWWTYEVCYKKHVRQYHKEHSKVLSEYLLGQYSAADSSADIVQVRGGWWQAEVLGLVPLCCVITSRMLFGGLLAVVLHQGSS